MFHVKYTTLVFIIMFSCGKGFCKDGPAQSKTSHWKIRAGFGFDLLQHDFNKDFRTHGIGGSLGIGRDLNDHLAAWLVCDYFYFPRHLSTFDLEIRQEAYFVKPTIVGIYQTDFYGSKPYLGIGFGLFTSYSFGGDIFEGEPRDNVNYSAPLIQFVAGFGFPIGKNISIYVESKPSMIFYSEKNPITTIYRTGADWTLVIGTELRL